MNEVNWQYDSDCDTWLMGNPYRGAGVHIDDSEESDDFTWTGTVVYDGDILDIGSHPTREAAMTEALDVFTKRQQVAE